MREIIRIAALTGALLVSGAAVAQEVPRVPLDLAIERLEAAGIEVLGTGNARFTENDMLFLRDKGVVMAATVVDDCVVPEFLILGTYKPEYGI